MGIWAPRRNLPRLHHRLCFRLRRLVDVGSFVTPAERAQTVSRWEEWRRALYEERAAIQEHLGKLPREEAERLAFEAYKPQPKLTQPMFDFR